MMAVMKDRKNGEEGYADAAARASASWKKK
jgi:hypothetical protein